MPTEEMEKLVAEVNIMLVMGGAAHTAVPGAVGEVDDPCESEQV